MRVLHVYAGNLYGGVETFLATLARSAGPCPELRHEFALCFRGRLWDELEQAHATVHPLGTVRASRPWTVLRARRALARLLDGGSYGCVICHACWSQAIFGPVARRCGIPLVFYLHGPISRLTWLDRWAARTVPDVMVAVSGHTATTGKRLYPRVQTEVLHYPLPWDQVFSHDRQHVRAELGARPDETVILQASRMDAWKGHEQHLAALGRIRDVSGWVCWIAGGPQRPAEVKYEARLKAQVDALGIADRVRFLGERRDVRRLLAGADLFCQANTGPEGFSLAFIEAFAAGLPIITTRLGGAPELIDETCGMLTDPGDVDAIAAAIERLVSEPDTRRRMSSAARARVMQRSDPVQQMDRLSRILRSAATARDRSVGFNRTVTKPVPGES